MTTKTQVKSLKGD